MLRNYSKYNDKELLKTVHKGGDKGEQAFVEIYNRYALKIRTYCQCIINNFSKTDELAADDIFQDAIVIFYKKINEGVEVENIHNYLLVIARNLCMNYNRNRKFTVPIDSQYFYVDESAKYEKAEMFELINKALTMIDAKYREAFILREFQGLKMKEIADICGISVPGAKSRVQRAHKQIMKVLSPYINDLKL